MSPVGVRVRPHPPVPGRGQAFSSGLNRPFVEQLVRLVAPQPVLELLQPRPGPSSRRPSVPGGPASPSSLCPPTSAGEVQPFGVRRTIIGQRGAELPLARASFWTARMSSDARVDRGGHRLVHRLRVGPLDEVGHPPGPRKNASISS